MSLAAIEARVKAKARARDPRRMATRGVELDKARREANLKAAGIVLPISEWLGHNNGPAWDADELWLMHCWREAVKKAWEPPSQEIAVRRARKAAALGLSYRAYTLEILERGRYLSQNDLGTKSNNRK